MHLDWLELAIGIVGIVAGDLVEVDLADVRRINRLVATGGELLANKPLEHAPYRRPLGHPEHQPRADQGADSEQVELLAKHPMVPLAGLLERLQMPVEVFLGKPGRPVEPLQLGVVGIPFPIGTSQAR